MFQQIPTAARRPAGPPCGVRLLWGTESTDEGRRGLPGGGRRFPLAEGLTAGQEEGGPRLRLFGGATWPRPGEEGLDEKFGKSRAAGAKRRSWAGCQASGQRDSLPARPLCKGSTGPAGLVLTFWLGGGEVGVAGRWMLIA